MPYPALYTLLRFVAKTAKMPLYKTTLRPIYLRQQQFVPFSWPGLTNREITLHLNSLSLHETTSMNLDRMNTAAK